MLKKNIIRKNFEFQEIINSKVQTVSKTLILYYRPNQNELRVGISISKKFANAVNRNFYRRQVRKILDEIQYYNLAMDVIIILRKAFLVLNYEQKKQELKKILARLRDAK